MQMLIKQNKLSNNYKRFLLLLSICVFFFSFTGCGKRTPPLPPIERIPQRVTLSGFQRGNQIILSWQMPQRNAGESSILNINRIEIYRLAENAASPLTLNDEEFSAQSTMIHSMPVTDADFSRKTLTYTDTLEFSGQPVRLRYAIRLVNNSDQRAAFSNFFLIEPAPKSAKSPTAVRVRVTEPALVLSWNAPIENVDGSKPANILGYNVYRSSNETGDFSLLNKTPVNKNEFSDTSFEFGNKYRYFVRAISLGTDGQPVESTNSETFNVGPVDTFAPAPPTGITIAAAPNSISLFFAVNTEKDIAGYRIYRSENPSILLSEWTLITPELLTTNTYQDKTVQSGKTYYYYIKAFDKTGNVSQPSEQVSETVP